MLLSCSQVFHCLSPPAVDRAGGGAGGGAGRWKVREVVSVTIEHLKAQNVMSNACMHGKCACSYTPSTCPVSNDGVVIRLGNTPPLSCGLTCTNCQYHKYYMCIYILPSMNICHALVVMALPKAFTMNNIPHTQPGTCLPIVIWKCTMTLACPSAGHGHAVGSCSSAPYPLPFLQPKSRIT